VRTLGTVRLDPPTWATRLNVVVNRPAFAASLLAALAAAVGLIYLFVVQPGPALDGDTPSYLYFDPGRPIGYPVILRLIHLLTGGYEAVRPFQILLFVLAAFVASWAVFRHGWGYFAAFAFELGVLVYRGPIGLADSIMSDSVAASLYLFYLAAVLNFVRCPSLRRFWLPCLVMAALITIRPVGVALIASNLALLLLYRRELCAKFLPSSAVLLGLALAGWFATPITHSLISGESAGTPLARGLLQKVILEEPGAGRVSSCEANFIESLSRPALNYMRTVPPQHRDLMRLRYSSYLRFKSIIPGLAQRHQFAREADADPILMCYSLARIRQDPVAFLHVTAHDYWGLVTNHTYITQRQHDDYVAFIAAHPPPLPTAFRNTETHNAARAQALRDIKQDAAVQADFAAEEVSFGPSRARPVVLTVAVNATQVVATLIGILCIGFVVVGMLGFRVPEGRTTIGILAIAAQVSLALTAVVEIALPRYVFPVWPYYWLTIIFFALWSFRKLRSILAGDGVFAGR
jgi:hypothetical protein